LQLASGIQSFNQWNDMIMSLGGAFNGTPAPPNAGLKLLQKASPSRENYPVTRDPEM
jgi:hypothetical protein